MRIPWTVLFVLLLSVLAVGLLASCEADDDDDDDDDTGDDDDINFDPPEITDGYSYIPCGTFLMGSPADETGRRENEAQHQVSFSHDFELMQQEVTQEQFEAFLGFNPSFYPEFGTDGLTLPVEQVSWYDALAYANKTSEAYGLPVCYNLSNIVCDDEAAGDSLSYCSAQGGIWSADVALNGTDLVYGCQGFRLPTEAEWEYAVRAETTTPFSSGELLNPACTPLDYNLDRVAWYCGNSNDKTHSVGLREPNPWNLFDVYGNVMEWTNDWYADDPGDQLVDPAGPAEGYFKVARGGAARFSSPVFCRSAFRTGHSVDYQGRRVGFRLARSLETTYPFNVCGEADPELKIAPAPEKDATLDLPRSLPFEYTREPAGIPPSQAEINEFTREITAFWADTDYFNWNYWLSHGMHASNPNGTPDYKLYWQDFVVQKQGDLVTFEHTGNADNIMIRTGKLFNNTAALYLETGDPELGALLEQLCKGVVALFWGFQWTEDDPEPYLMPRAHFTEDHSYVENGKDVAVTYDGSKHTSTDWNGRSFPNDYNPYWEGVWVRSMRSKDDVPHIYRMIPWLMYLIQDAPDESVREQAAEALDYLQRFARDIVDTGYYIRSKDEQGNEMLPLNLDNNMVADLASFVIYEGLDPNAECNPKLSSALIGYGSALDVSCGNGIGEIYEWVATNGHYFNYAIIRYFHVATVTNALINGEDEVAYWLISGLERRADEYMAGNGNWQDAADWDADLAAYLLIAGAAGLPLTAQEARFVIEQYSLSAQHYATWPYWNMYDPSIPDGQYRYAPDRAAEGYRVLRSTEVEYLIEYCASPFKNPASVDPVDCDAVLDPTQWGL
ncbi:MAG: formylglycine-generating enzyme family protein [Candidatus Alcyoniella australis]|nr:formylglycine-generating enzyme family protein [Candidatus Alcyoniella australis]